MLLGVRVTKETKGMMIGFIGTTFFWLNFAIHPKE